MFPAAKPKHPFWNTSPAYQTAWHTVRQSPNFDWRVIYLHTSRYTETYGDSSTYTRCSPLFWTNRGNWGHISSSIRMRHPVRHRRFCRRRSGRHLEPSQTDSQDMCDAFLEAGITVLPREPFSVRISVTLLLRAQVLFDCPFQCAFLRSKGGLQMNSIRSNAALTSPKR